VKSEKNIIIYVFFDFENIHLHYLKIELYVYYVRIFFSLKFFFSFFVVIICRFEFIYEVDLWRPVDFDCIIRSTIVLAYLRRVNTSFVQPYFSIKLNLNVR